MPRAARVQYPGAVYHVMCRGDRREAIFRNDDDRLFMLEMLGETCERTGFLVHSYVLMPNGPVKQAVAWWVKSEPLCRTDGSANN